jgi:hypothetical protein
MQLLAACQADLYKAAPLQVSLLSGPLKSAPGEQDTKADAAPGSVSPAFAVDRNVRFAAEHHFVKPMNSYCC